LQDTAVLQGERQRLEEAVPPKRYLKEMKVKSSQMPVQETRGLVGERIGRLR